MKSSLSRGLLRAVIMFTLLFALAVFSYAETATYIYDELNRLKRVEYTDGTAIEYSYDKVGNRLGVTIFETEPPQGSITAPASSNSTNVTLTLNCTDNVGCYQMQLSNDNNHWSDLLDYATTTNWILQCGDGQKTVYVKYKDAAGNWSSTYQTSINLVTDGCANPYVKVGEAYFCTLQKAYSDSATTDNSVIQSRAMQFVENLVVDRNIVLTLRGGYDCNFSTYTGNTTSIKGMISTTVGGGKITLGNVILEK
jgi:YD repeat-containing protein